MRFPSFVVLFSSIFAINSVVGVNGCPYDILAMCCVKTNANGGCTQWKNCCSLFDTVTSGSDDNQEISRQVSLIAGKTCVERCNGNNCDADGCDGCQDSTRSLTSIFACYSSCAERVDDSGGCIVLTDSSSQFGPHDKCCVATSRDRSLVAADYDRDYDDYHYFNYRSPLCDEWQDCRLVERLPSRYERYYLPKADGSCVKDCGTIGSTCYEMCANPPANGFDGPFGLQAPCIEIPTLFGHSTAYVPMTHVSIGIDVNTHGLATEDGNLNMGLTVSFCCGESSGKIEKIEIFPVGEPGDDPDPTPGVYDVPGAVGSSSFSGLKSVQPFTLDDLDEACEMALGGSWLSPGLHKNSEQIVETMKTKPITIRAKCKKWQNEVVRVYYVSLNPITCDDNSFFVPPP